MMPKNTGKKGKKYGRKRHMGKIGWKGKGRGNRVEARIGSAEI